MSVYIKGMRMPENCWECEIKQYDEYEEDYVCPFSGVVCLTIGRQDSCPLVALPDKHGDLIDRDEVRDSVFHHLSIKGEENLLPAEKSVFGNIIKAKVVIEAEGE